MSNNGDVYDRLRELVRARDRGEKSESERKAVVMDVVDQMIRENPDVKRAYHTMKSRGLSVASAKEELGRALIGCLFEAARQLPDRWPEVLAALEDGRTTTELFPDSLYDDKGKPY